MATLGAGVAAAQLFPLNSCLSGRNNPSFNGASPQFRTDPRFTEFKGLPWRKVHLDFHNSKYIPAIGDKFDEEVWGDRLVAGNVDSIVVFAKDMHGYFYYPSRYGPVHPGLSFDLLGAQVKACRERNIAVYAYYCVAWDHHLAETHPEWNMRKRDGSDYRPKEGEIPGWTALCLGNTDFVDLVSQHVKEFVTLYQLDGAWLDMAEPIAPECYCSTCMKEIRQEGNDPFDKEVQRAHQNANFIRFHQRMHDLVHSIRTGCQADFNDIGLSRVSERAEWLDNIDIEALPTGGWGYYYAPAQIRYQRNFGVPVFGMTGRFVSSWADFGGLKLPQQLDTELASIVANAARCDVGDQMPPNGELDRAVYHVLGKSFGRIKMLEPWLEQASPVTEAALLIPDRPLERLRESYIYGITKLMIEAQLQFDVVEEGQKWEDYSLVVIPDDLMLRDESIERLHKFVSGGGAVLVSHHAGLSATKRDSWLAGYGLHYEGDSKFTPAYMVTEDGFAGEIPGYAYALYNGASQWRAESPARSLAMLGEPLFQRSAAHYTSHRQTPFSHVTGYTMLAVSGKVGLAAFPLGSSYYDKGYWIYRAAFMKLLDEIYPLRLIESKAPLNTEITITWQPADPEIKRRERYLVHLVNWSPTRKTPPHPEVHEDPVPLFEVPLKLNIPVENVKVTSITGGLTLPHRIEGCGIEVTVPVVQVHEIVCFESTS